MFVYIIILNISRWEINSLAKYLKKSSASAFYNIADNMASAL